MTARDALARAVATPSGERLHLFETVCVPRGACRRERLTNDPDRWTWCPDCLTVSDDYGVAVNPIPEFAKTDDVSQFIQRVHALLRCACVTP